MLAQQKQQQSLDDKVKCIHTRLDDILCRRSLDGMCLSSKKQVRGRREPRKPPPPATVQYALNMFDHDMTAFLGRFRLNKYSRENSAKLCYTANTYTCVLGVNTDSNDTFYACSSSKMQVKGFTSSLIKNSSVGVGSVDDSSILFSVHVPNKPVTLKIGIEFNLKRIVPAPP